MNKQNNIQIGNNNSNNQANTRNIKDENFRGWLIKAVVGGIITILVTIIIWIIKGS